MLARAYSTDELKVRLTSGTLVLVAIEARIAAVVLTAPVVDAASKDAVVGGVFELAPLPPPPHIQCSWSEGPGAIGDQSAETAV